LIAAREDAGRVTMKHLEDAKDRVLMGAERKLMLTEQEKKITAYHEAGHTLVARFSPGADPVHKVSIIPRGQALGVTQQLPQNDRYHYPRSYLSTRLAVSLGGRAAEKSIFGEVSTGAQNDLKQVTELAEKMVCQWGMSERIGPVFFSRGEEHPFLGRKLATEKTFSERMAWLIDREIENIIKEAEARADEIIKEKHDLLEQLAQVLLEEETIDEKRIDAIIQPGE
jgi:cell division protease FtsH